MIPEGIEVAFPEPQLESPIDQLKSEKEEVAEPISRDRSAAGAKREKSGAGERSGERARTRAGEAPPAKKDKFVQARQEVMQFEPVTRGRFEKSEPTIVEGQDLDVPTYLRKNVRVK